MIRDFSKEELEPVDTSRDTELTLGAGTLLVLAAGFLMVCGVCFGVGYTLGHRSSTEKTVAMVAPPQASKSSAAQISSNAKPGAAEVARSSQAFPAVDDPGQVGGVTDSAPAGSAMTTAGPGQAQVKPAFASQVRPALSAAGTQPSAPLKVQPATTQVQGWMVQIAAVSHTEDAQVLVDALRKRGYEVTARRDLGDNMMHVQTGPFVNRSDANAMRQKLLSDGYNAIVQ